MSNTGILVTNGDNHILISSDFQSFHFLGTATYIHTSLSGLTEFPYFSGDSNTLSGRHLHKYAVTMPNKAVPLVFIRPGNNLAYSVLRQYPYGDDFKEWHIEIMQRGPVPVKPMSILCFYQLTDIYEPLDGYGMVTRVATGEIGFDTARNPMSIVESVVVTPPEIPCDGGQPSDSSPKAYSWQNQILDHDFHCDSTETAYRVGAIDTLNMAFTAPALAQAVYSRRKYGYKRSNSTYNSQEHWSTAHWWCMYHAAYRFEHEYFFAGWLPFAAGYNYDESYEDGGIFGGGGGNTSFGEQPYKDTTINYGPNAAIMINAYNYTGDYADDPVLIAGEDPVYYAPPENDAPYDPFSDPDNPKFEDPDNPDPVLFP